MASPNISFDQIPGSIRKPGVYFELNTKNANSALPANLQKVLLVAQKATAGTAVANSPIQVFDTAAAETLFGKGSVAHFATRDAIKASRNLALFVLPVADNGSGVKAVRTLNVSASSNLGGAIVLFVNGQRFEIGTAKDETADSIATKICAALAADSFLPYVVTGSAAAVVLTAVNAGTIGSEIPLEIDVSAASGVSIALVETTAGSADPDISTALAGAAAERFHVLALTTNSDANIAIAKTWIDTQSGPIEKKAGRVVFATDPDNSVAQAIAKSEAVNSGRVSNVYLRKSKSSAASIAAAFAAIDAGEEDPARPLNTLVLAGIQVPTNRADFLSRTEQEALLYGGVTPIEPTASKTEAAVVRWITTYTENAAGSPDPTLLDGTTIKTLDYTRDAVVGRLETRFPRAKLSSKTPGRVRTEVIDVLLRLDSLEILENVEANLDRVIVERDSQDVNRLNVKIPADVVNGLHVIAGVIDLVL